MIAVTGASGHLGRLVIDKLLTKLPASEIVSAVRTPDKVWDLAEQGVEAREANYDHPDTLDKAFEGVDKLLLISSSEVGRRAQQHKAVIDAAKKAGVGLIAYTSILHADTSPLGLREEHLATEEYLRESGVPFVLLRNGWYTENYTAGLSNVLERGVLHGCAGAGRIASAAREDYAEAAAVVLTRDNQAGKVYELAGDEAYTLADLAAEISRQSNKDIEYKNLSRQEYKAMLLEAGLPEPVAEMLADSEDGASQGGLYDDSRELSRLIGRPTTPLAESVRVARGG